MYTSRSPPLPEIREPLTRNLSGTGWYRKLSAKGFSSLTSGIHGVVGGVYIYISGSMLEYENSEENRPPLFLFQPPPLPFSLLLAVAVAFPESFTGEACKLAQRRHR